MRYLFFFDFCHKIVDSDFLIILCARNDEKNSEKLAAVQYS